MKPLTAHRFPAPILVIAAAGLYAGSLRNGFVYDDALQVLDNPWIRDFHHVPEMFTSHVWAFTDRSSEYYRPLMHLLYAVLYVPFGPWPAVFHGLNVALHAATTLLVFGLTRSILEHSREYDAAVSALPVFLAALVFAAHPIHVEAVAWVGALPDLVCGTFYVAALWAFVAAWRGTGRDRLLHVAGSLCFLISALLKEPGVTLPAAVAALDLAHRPHRRGPAFWAVRYGALAAAAAVYLALRLQALDGIAPRAAESPFSSAPPLHLVGAAVWRYTGMLVFPHPLNAFRTLDAGTPLLPGIALLALPAALIVALWRRSTAWVAALATFLMPLLPALCALVLLPGLDNPWAERYTYLPSAGLVIAVALSLTAASRRGRTAQRGAVAATVAIVLLFSGMTVARVRVWRDDLTLWTDTVTKSPNAGVAHGARGHALLVRGDLDAALAELTIAVELKPDHADSQANLGVVLALEGRHEDALGPYAAALRLRPGSALVHADIAISLSAVGRATEAVAEAEHAIRLRPELAKGHHALGVALGNAGRVGEAATEFRRAIALDPQDARSRANLERAEALLRER